MAKKRNEMGKVIINFLSNLAYSLRAIAYVNPAERLKYKKRTLGCIYVLGNGPSLKDKLAKIEATNDSTSTFAVNDFGVSSYYAIIRPTYYMLVDPAYWNEEVNIADKELREKLYSNMNELTKWPMTLYVPSSVIKIIKRRNFITNPNITIQPFNYTNFHPSQSSYFKFILKHNFGVVPVGNILGQAIYASIQLGYSEVQIYGAEHSWTEDIRVNDMNEVCTIKKHFFSEDEETLIPWCKTNGEVFKMHEILTSLRNHFYGYWFLNWYSQEVGVKVFNCTPKSFIDAFERKK